MKFSVLLAHLLLLILTSRFAVAATGEDDLTPEQISQLDELLLDSSMAVDEDGSIADEADADKDERWGWNKHPLHSLFKKKKKYPFLTFVTSTESTTTTIVLTSSTVGLCAKLVNVTGPCRLRRGMWVDEPVVLTFDEDLDSIDALLSPSAVMR